MWQVPQLVWKRRLAALQVGGDLLVARRRVALGAEHQPGDDDREDQDQQAEDDEGSFAHVFAADAKRRDTTVALARYQGHIRRSSHSSQRGFGRQSSRPCRIRFMCSS